MGDDLVAEAGAEELDVRVVVVYFWGWISFCVSVGMEKGSEGVRECVHGTG